LFGQLSVEADERVLDQLEKLDMNRKNCFRGDFMSRQLSLFQVEKEITRDEGTGKIKHIVKDGHDKSYCINHLETDGWIWDMRAWDNYKDREEVEKWVDEIKRKTNYLGKNSGHSAWCIKQLLLMGTDPKEIVDAIMKNPHIQYKNRLVRCFDKGIRCKHWTNKNGYSGCPCEDCQ